MELTSCYQIGRNFSIRKQYPKQFSNRCRLTLSLVRLQDQQRVLRGRRRDQHHPAGQAHEGLPENPGTNCMILKICFDKAWHKNGKKNNFVLNANLKSYTQAMYNSQRFDKEESFD
jgi:hypothetical protein